MRLTWIKVRPGSRNKEAGVYRRSFALFRRFIMSTRAGLASQYVATAANPSPRMFFYERHYYLDDDISRVSRGCAYCFGYTPKLPQSKHPYQIFLMESPGQIIRGPASKNSFEPYGRYTSTCKDSVTSGSNFTAIKMG